MRYSWALKHNAVHEGNVVAIRGDGDHDASPARRRRAHGDLRRAADAELAAPDRPVGPASAEPTASMLMIYNLHLSPHEIADSRRSEAARVNEIVAAIGDDPPPIVAGDFNDAGRPVDHRRPPRRSSTSLPSNTNPSEAPTQALDHVLLAGERDRRVDRRTRRGSRLGSDLRPPPGDGPLLAPECHRRGLTRSARPCCGVYFFFLASAAGALSTPLASASSR